MAIKGNKRPMASADVAVKTNEQQPSKKKLKVNNTKPVGQTNGVAPQNKKKVETKPKPVKVENASTAKPENGKAPTKAPVKADNKDVVKTVDDGAKMAAILKQKAKKKEQRLKKIEGFAPELIKATPEQLQEKIDNIVNRELITKTARRRLAVLKKKLLIKQGLYNPESPKQAPTMSKNTKRKLRRLNKTLGASAESEATPVDAVKTQAEKAAKAVKGLKATMAEKKAAQHTTVASKKEKNVGKKNSQDSKLKPKVEKAKVVVEEESEDDDEEDEDEEQNESMDVSNDISINDDDNEDDDDEDDDEDDEEDDDAGVQVNDKKNEKPGNKNQDKNINESKKKTRYVLFVGNIPFTTVEEELKKHFLTKVSDVVSVRIPHSPENKPRGFAYVEFSNSLDYEKGLSLHETQFRGNRIRVQYASNKRDGKKGEFVAKNNKLHALRKQGKLAGSTKFSQKRNVRRNKGEKQAA